MCREKKLLTFFIFHRIMPLCLYDCCHTSCHRSLAYYLSQGFGVLVVTGYWHTSCRRRLAYQLTQGTIGMGSVCPENACKSQLRLFQFLIFMTLSEYCYHHSVMEIILLRPFSKGPSSVNLWTNPATIAISLFIYRSFCILLSLFDVIIFIRDMLYPLSRATTLDQFTDSNFGQNFNFHETFSIFSSKHPKMDSAWLSVQRQNMWLQLLLQFIILFS